MALVFSDEWMSFLDSIEKAVQSMGQRDDLWYRGQASDSFSLLPSLLRYRNGLEREAFIFSTFQKYADRLSLDRESEWEMLFHMQHYGVPTRLLDWSETLGVAVFFALNLGSRSKYDGDAAIYVSDWTKRIEQQGWPNSATER